MRTYTVRQSAWWHYLFLICSSPHTCNRLHLSFPRLKWQTRCCGLGSGTGRSASVYRHFLTMPDEEQACTDKQTVADYSEDKTLQKKIYFPKKGWTVLNYYFKQRYGPLTFEWVRRVLLAVRHIIGHFGDESFETITCTSTDNSK